MDEKKVAISWLTAAAYPVRRRSGTLTVEFRGTDREIDAECERLSLANGGASLTVTPR